MAVTVALVEATPYRLRYLATSDGLDAATLTIANATLVADLPADHSGPIRAVIRAGTDGIGTDPTGVLTQAQARCLLLSDNTTSIGNDNVPHAITSFTRRTGTGIWFWDANVDGGGLITVEITSSAVAGTGYLDIHVRHSIDL